MPGGRRGALHARAHRSLPGPSSNVGVESAALSPVELRTDEGARAGESRPNQSKQKGPPAGLSKKAAGHTASEPYTSGN